MRPFPPLGLARLQDHRVARPRLLDLGAALCLLAQVGRVRLGGQLHVDERGGVRARGVGAQKGHIGVLRAPVREVVLGDRDAARREQKEEEAVEGAGEKVADFTKRRAKHKQLSLVTLYIV